jgi:hypothetical protein
MAKPMNSLTKSRLELYSSIGKLCVAIANFRSDAPDPALPWTGMKNSGRGCTLSKFGFEQFIRYSSRNYKTVAN